MNERIVCLSDCPELLPAVAAWFHDKWGVPEAAYIESMTECLRGGAAVPQWYAVMAGERMIGGCGVIANDFHNRPDLTPNVCGVYVEADCRKRGIAERLLSFVCEDMHARGVGTLYLLTDHTGFYERYGWEYLAPVQGDGEDYFSQMYVRRANGL